MNASTNNHQADHWKLRGGPAGLHVFNRTTGLNVLIDEIPVPASLHSRAPRQVSIALTNRCDLACAHCYAPKSLDELRFDVITRWLAEFDSHGALGVGFGGGEPTLYPNFVRLCQHAARETRLSVSFTTHGHHIDDVLAERLRGSVHFVRVSMDGVGATYESIRRRSFPELLARLKLVRSISRFGINVVINDRTLPDLNAAAVVAADAGACELLLLPQMPVRSVPAIAARTLQGLRRWVDSYRGPLKLCIKTLDHGNGDRVALRGEKDGKNAQSGMGGGIEVAAVHRIGPFRQESGAMAFEDRSGQRGSGTKVALARVARAIPVLRKQGVERAASCDQEVARVGVGGCGDSPLELRATLHDG